MKFRLVLTLTLMSVVLASGAPVPVYRNSTFVQSPPGAAPVIDATTFINESYFEVNDFNIIPIPYQTTHTEHFRNEASGTMLGHPGYLFEYVNGNTRLPMTSWFNRGSISSYASPSNQIYALTTGNFVWVRSDGITNSGTLNATEQGLIKLDGNILNLTRGRLRTGTSTDFNAFFGGGWLGNTNGYFNDPGITDVYWGVGTNNVVAGMGATMQLSTPGGVPSFSPPYSSAVHQAIQPTPSGFFTNQGLVIQDSFQGNSFMTAAFRTNIGGETIVQVAFVKTNWFEPAITADVRFVNDFSDVGRTVVVGYHARERDVALDREITNSVYLFDALAFETNAVAVRNLAGTGTRRPSTYEVSKGAFFSPFTLSNSAPNVTYTNSLLYRTSFTDSAVNVDYAAYAAQISGLNITGPDPATYPGRVEILANTLNLRETRVRAESTLIVRANNLVSNNLAQMSAPFIKYDVGTTQPTLVISNLAPPSVSRLSGGIRAWSATWRNTEVVGGVTNNFRFHVLFVDNTLTTNQPVSLHQFHVRGANIIVHDPLRVQQSLRVQGDGVHIKSNAALNFPSTANWSGSTIVNVRNFTNDGRVILQGSAFVGTDRGFGYDNFVNRGTNEAALWSILAGRFENSGCLRSVLGRLDVSANNVILEGRPPWLSSNLVFNPSTFEFELQPATNFNAKVEARTDLHIVTGGMSQSNAHLFAGTATLPGLLTIDASTRLTDAGAGQTNRWQASGGIQVLRYPSQARDLMYTYATVRATEGSEVIGLWPANDLGAVPLGYSNNLALGKLTLDGAEQSAIRLRGLASKTALYVDYLELLNNATNYLGENPSMIVEPSLTLYFAHSNVEAAKLNGAQSNRIRWVKFFAGPLSSTNITYPSGNVYPVNISLARDADLDSDGDGTVNRRDRTPIYVAESVQLRATRESPQTNQVLLSWQALANSTSYLEFKPNISTGPWQLLRSTTAPASMRITVPDSTAGAGRTQRIYRVRVDLPQQ